MRRFTAGLLAAIPLLAACGSTTRVATNAANPSLHPAPDTTPSATAAPLAELHNGTPPGPMRGFDVGYDPVTRQLILHAGSTIGDNPTYISQTWAWDGQRWTRLAPRTELPPQAGGAMSVDPVSGHLMFMGGDAFSESSDAGGNNVASWSPNLGTWLWDGATWKRVADNPAQGGGPALAVDDATHQLLVNSPDIRGVGTTDDLESSGPAWYTHGSFRWTGTAWRPVPAHDDTQWLFAAIAYDPISRRLIQAGGQAQNPVEDTEAWDGSRWTKLSPPNPTTEGPAAAATDRSTGRVVLLTMSPDKPSLCATWTWDGGDWVRQIVDEPPQSILNGGTAQMVWDPALGRIILVAWAGGSSKELQMWAWDGVDSGWEKLAP